MYQIITPTLFHNKICKLPGIGTLVMVSHPAETDFINSILKSPAETIDFIPEKEGEKEFNEFSAMSELLNQQLEAERLVFLKGVGTFTKDDEGIIKFAAVEIDPVFFPVVPIERVIRENAEHKILVGDQHTTNVEMTEFFNKKPLIKDRWKLIALLIGAICLALLIFYLSRHGFNMLGNSKSI
jgi:hypothetical protein